MCYFCTGENQESEHYFIYNTYIYIHSDLVLFKNICLRSISIK